MKRLLSSVSVVLTLLFFLAAPASAAEINLIWDANAESDLAGYRVYLGAKAGGPYTRIAEVPSEVEPKFTYSVPGENEKTYFFVVTAYDVSGNESGYSNEVSVFVDESAPLVPKGLKIFVIVVP